jgi:hypothetical protein
MLLSVKEWHENCLLITKFKNTQNMKTISKSFLGAFLIVGSIALIGCKAKKKKNQKLKEKQKSTCTALGLIFFQLKRI